MRTSYFVPYFKANSVTPKKLTAELWKGKPQLPFLSFSRHRLLGTDQSFMIDQIFMH